MIGMRSCVILALGISAVGCNRDAAALPAAAGSVARAASAASVAPSVPAPGIGATRAAGETPNDDGLCKETCARSAPLHCEDDASCEARCREMRRIPVCSDELRTALSCFASVPTQGWECVDGAPSVKQGRCEQAQATFAECMGKVGQR